MASKECQLAIFEKNDWVPEYDPAFIQNIDDPSLVLPRLDRSRNSAGLVAIRPYPDEWLVAWVQTGGLRGSMTVRATTLAKGSLWTDLPHTARFLADTLERPRTFPSSGAVPATAARAGISCLCALIQSPGLLDRDPAVLSFALRDEGAPYLALSVAVAATLEQLRERPTVILGSAPSQQDLETCDDLGFSLVVCPATVDSATGLDPIAPLTTLQGVDLESLSDEDARLLYAGLFARAAARPPRAVLSLDDLVIPPHLLSADRLNDTAWITRIEQLRYTAASRSDRWPGEFNRNLRPLLGEARRFVERLVDLCELDTETGGDDAPTRRVLHELFGLSPERLQELHDLTHRCEP